MPLSAAEKQRRYRERLKKNKEKYEEAKKKHRERYHKTKRLVKDLTPKERYNANVIWKLRKRQLKERKRAVEGLLQQTPPDSPRSDSRLENFSEFNENPPQTPPRSTPPPEMPLPASPSARSPSIKVKLGRKKVKKDRSRVHRENAKLRQDNENLRRKYEKFKKRYHRKIGININKAEKNEDLRYKVLSGAIKKTFKNTKSRKEREVIKKIFETVEVKDSRMKKQILIENLGIDKIVKRKESIDKNTVLRKKIKNFYLRDDISRATAGKKETLTKAGIKVQKRFMLDTMKNLYKTFMKENPDLRCSYFYFTKNKPFYIISASIDARDMCLCKTHTNFAYKAKALKRSGITGTDNLSLLIESTVCSTNSKDCMYGICVQCATKANNYFIGNVKGTITWTEWVRKEEKYIKDGKILRTVKNVKEDREEKADIFIKIFESDLAAFKKHVFNIKTQFKSFRCCLEYIRSNECVVVADFSENYSCKHSQEVQSHHFGGSRKQVSLHTVVVYTFDSDSARGYKVNSFCSISASNNHQPAAIWSHLDPILKWIRSYFNTVNTLHFFSDGPSTQYRQKQNFYFMCTKYFDYGFSYMTWSFFEAGHGKGPADGIGGFLKRTADKIVANGDDISDVIQFYDKMNNVSKIKLYLIDEKDIEDRHTALPVNIPRLVGTLKVHQVFSSCYGKLKFRDLSCFCETGSPEVRGFCLCLNPKAYDIGVSYDVEEVEVNDEFSTIHSIHGLNNDETLSKKLITEDINIMATNCSLEPTNRNSTPKILDVETTSDDDDEPLCNLKFAKVLQDMTNTRRRIYDAIYGGSSSEEELPCGSHDQSTKIGRGDFLLVKLYVDAFKNKSYTYACKTLTDVEEDGEVKVMFLRVVDENAKRFRLDEKDISYVDYENIIQKLPAPEIIKKGHRSYYQFEKSVDVFEKK